MHWHPCTLLQWRSVLLLCAASNLDYLCEWERKKIRIEKNTMPLRRLMWSVNAQQLWTTVHCWTYEKQFIALKGCATSWKIDLFWKKGNSMFRAFTKSFSVISMWIIPKYHYESDWGVDDNVDHANAAGDARGW